MEIRKKIEVLVKTIPSGISPEDHRTACSVISGAMNNKTYKEIVKYYSLSASLSEKWWGYFNFGDIEFREKNKRGSKSSSLDSFVKSNFGNIYKSSDIVKICNITNPTLYNFINANRGYFKKVSRGEYQIIDADSERIKEKNAKS
jgi:hypothetical protein